MYSTIRPIILAWLMLLLPNAAMSQFSCDTPEWLPGTGFPGTSAKVYASVQWDPDGNGPEDPLIVLGGDFQDAGNIAASRIVAFNPNTQAWNTLGDGTNNTVYCLAVSPSGKLYAGGFFSIAG